MGEAAVLEQHEQVFSLETGVFLQAGSVATGSFRHLTRTSPQPRSRTHSPACICSLFGVSQIEPERQDLKRNTAGMRRGRYWPLPEDGRCWASRTESVGTNLTAPREGWRNGLSSERRDVHSKNNNIFSEVSLTGFPFTDPPDRWTPHPLGPGRSGAHGRRDAPSPQAGFQDTPRFSASTG